jgi:hypothetical protein
MTKTDYHRAKGLVIHAPPDGNRSLKLSDGRIWNSREAGVVFFETATYGDFTSAEWIGKLLDVLVRATSSRRIGLRIEPARIEQIPAWLSEPHKVNDILTARFDSEHLDEIVEFFDSAASYGVWDFYGLGSELEATTLEPLLNELNRCERYRFMVEVDLDGMLLGYARPQQSIGELASALSRIGTSKPQKA